MSQICLRNITIGHSALPLLEHADLVIEAGERVCLIGRNGAGKSTLLKLIKGDIPPDHGTVETTSGLRLSLLSQLIPEDLPGTVTEIMTQHVQETTLEPWEHAHTVSKMLSVLNLDGTQCFNQLSGGLKRLVLLASVLVQAPDVLLLDEPTNHLDLNKIRTLETLLLNFKKTLIFVTHDRALLEKLATHIVEIDQGRLISWHGDYPRYLVHKESLLAAEEKANALFDKRLAEEEVWIRQGIKARRTRNEGRVRQLKEMRRERALRRTRTGKVTLSTNQAKLSGKIVFEADHVSFDYDGKTILKNFSTVILRGDKVGIIGPNGIGKSTLVQLLLGQIQPTQGTIKKGTNLTIGYFDQHRLQLDDNKTIVDSISEIGETILVGDKQKHVMSYLQDFLFSPTQARSLIKNLSGGERNRVMLAKLFSKPCNVLVMDEPTNDLDIETLELLEEKLLHFEGTLLLISHDRTFLNNVATNILVFGEEGRVDEFLGGYDDWITQSTSLPQSKQKADEKKQKPIEKVTTKLTYKEQKELTELPNKIHEIETKQAKINEQLSNPEFYKNHPDEMVRLTKSLGDLAAEVAELYARWEMLEQKEN